MYFQLVERLKAKHLSTQGEPDWVNLHRLYRVVCVRTQPSSSPSVHDAAQILHRAEWTPHIVVAEQCSENTRRGGFKLKSLLSFF